MDEHARHLVRIGHPRGAALGADQPGIADLAAGLGVERRLVHDDLHSGAGRRGIDLRAVLHQRQDLPRGMLGVVAEKLGRALRFGDVIPDGRIRRLARARPGGARLGLLRRHRGIEPPGLDAAALFAQRVLGKVEREAKGVVELERGFTRQFGALGQRGELFVEQLQAAIERGLEASLFGQQRFLDQHLSAAELRVGLAHLAHEFGHQPVHHRILRAEQVGVAHGAAHDPAQHVAAPLVRGHNAVGQQEGGGAQMVGNHAQVHVAVAVRVGIGHMRRSLDQRPHQVGVVVVMLALQQRADPLQPHAGVDRLHVEGAHRAILELLILHEHEVPDLDEPVAVFVG